MSINEQQKKRARTDDDNGKALVTGVIATKPAPPSLLLSSSISPSSSSIETRVVVAAPTTTTTPRHVYIVFTCQYPLHNEKWGEHSGHETEDTQVVGVYASLTDANRCGKDMMAQYTDENDDDDDGHNGDLFYWQDDEPSEWTARRVWVEKQDVH